MTVVSVMEVVPLTLQQQMRVYCHVFSDHLHHFSSLLILLWPSDWKGTFFSSSFFHSFFSTFLPPSHLFTCWRIRIYLHSSQGGNNNMYQQKQILYHFNNLMVTGWYLTVFHVNRLPKTLKNDPFFLLLFPSSSLVIFFYKKLNI